MYLDALLFDFLGKALDMIWQTITPQVLLLDDHEIDTISFSLFADIPGFSHVRGVDRAVHTKPVEYSFGFIDEIFGAVLWHKLGQIGLSKLMDVVQLAV